MHIAFLRDESCIKTQLRVTTLIRLFLTKQASSSTDKTYRYSIAVTGDPVVAYISVRSSKTMFGKSRNTPSQLPGLSVNCSKCLLFLFIAFGFQMY